MKKRLFFVALSAMFCLGSAAQNDEFTEVPDTVSEVAIDESISSNSMFNMVQGFTSIGRGAGPAKELIYPLGKGLFKKHHIEQAIEVYPNITKSKVSQSELLSGESLEDISDTGYGLNFGYSLIFIPGREKQGNLHLNKAGFAYSVGVIASFSVSDRYGALCEFMAKAGVETCHNRKMGVGFDFLAGYGKSSGDVFFYTNIVEDTGPSKITPYTAWGKRFGGQIWIKTGLLGNAISNTDVLLFARLIKAVNPQIMSNDYSLLHHNLWRQENWSFGIILRYRM